MGAADNGLRTYDQRARHGYQRLVQLRVRAHAAGESDRGGDREHRSAADGGAAEWPRGPIQRIFENAGHAVLIFGGKYEYAIGGPSSEARREGEAGVRKS